MGSYRAKLKNRAALVVAGRPVLNRLAHLGARRWAGQHFVAAVAVVLDGDDVLLASHRFHGGHWFLPGGWVRRREDPAHACARELEEELGLRVQVIAPVACELHAVDGVPVRYGGLSIAFRCVLQDPSTRAPSVQSVEIADARWSPIGTLSDHVEGFQLAAVDAAIAHRLGPRGE